ncbi:hydrolase [Pilimelia anulata]|uniref:Lysozyme n=1 Tax=Pilimelia anulata TaxID=53371 RepID=A0A8J3F828_9ACTN|nr:GH25 family lysozyme [Pilimelia anulata]GGJ84629.1 hydrolase [Pilimelia anulata]
MTLRLLAAAVLAPLLLATAPAAAAPVPTARAPAARTAGVDVSHHQGVIDWGRVHGAGIRFAYLKATEGTSFRDPQFTNNYPRAHAAGIVRGAYHFARPAASSGAAQANFLADHGGAWSADNLTLPAAVDLEAGCHGLSQAAMRGWVADFLNTYRSRTGRYAVIYTTTDWWRTCTGDDRSFWANHPLWVARWADAAGALPPGAGVYSFWQYTDKGRVDGINADVDRDWFNGAEDRLRALANNTR